MRARGLEFQVSDYMVCLCQSPETSECSSGLLLAPAKICRFQDPEDPALSNSSLWISYFKVSGITRRVNIEYLLFSLYNNHNERQH